MLHNTHLQKDRYLSQSLILLHNLHNILTKGDVYKRQAMSCLAYVEFIAIYFKQRYIEHTKGRKLDTLEQLEIHKHTTVSYTHLDVYKRQLEDSMTTLLQAVEYMT